MIHFDISNPRIREKRRQSLLGNKNAVGNKSQTGKKFPNRFLVLPDNRGEKHPNWKGGISKKNKEEIAGRPKPGNCELCKKQRKRIVFDHCHKTGKFRGWLCNGCNVTLGMVGESKELLLRMIEYIEKGGLV